MLDESKVDEKCLLLRILEQRRRREQKIQFSRIWRRQPTRKFRIYILTQFRESFRWPFFKVILKLFNCKNSLRKQGFKEGGLKNNFYKMPAAKS